jgi:hypothetical protein
MDDYFVIILNYEQTHIFLSYDTELFFKHKKNTQTDASPQCP